MTLIMTVQKAATKGMMSRISGLLEQAATAEAAEAMRESRSAPSATESAERMAGQWQLTICRRTLIVNR
jgi:hypothetical protein